MPCLSQQQCFICYVMAMTLVNNISFRSDLWRFDGIWTCEGPSSWTTGNPISWPLHVLHMTSTWPPNMTSTWHDLHIDLHMTYSHDLLSWPPHDLISWPPHDLFPWPRPLTSTDPTVLSCPARWAIGSGLDCVCSPWGCWWFPSSAGRPPRPRRRHCSKW